MTVVSVVVSSTFADFPAERDLLVGPVRERLDALVKPLGARVELVDLRWAVGTAGADAAARAVFDAYLAEIPQAPVFLGLLGDRYGSVPDPAPARAVAAGLEIPEGVEGLSQTALEFGVRVLWTPTPAGENVVVFRDLAGTPPAGWVDADPAPAAGLRDEVTDRVQARSDIRVARYTACVTADGGVDLGAVISGGRPVDFVDLMVDVLSGPVQRRAAHDHRASAQAPEATARVPGLVGVFLDALPERLEPGSAMLLDALAVSRSGLTPADLAAVLAADDAASPGCHVSRCPGQPAQGRGSVRTAHVLPRRRPRGCRRASGRRRSSSHRRRARRQGHSG
ncbi:MAG: DUF4062 domain-containing protein [Gordonia sp. (in: high G+C Gram-positive bacteria)]